MIEGERELKTMHGYTVTFRPGSTIIRSKEEKDEDGEMVFHHVSLDPSDLSVIYAAYTQMVQEGIELEKARKE